MINNIELLGWNDDFEEDTNIIVTNSPSIFDMKMLKRVECIA